MKSPEEVLLRNNFYIAVSELMVTSKILGDTNELWIVCKRYITKKYNYAVTFKKYLDTLNIKVIELNINLINLFLIFKAQRAFILG